MVRYMSKPEKAKMDRLRPTANAEREPMFSGLNEYPAKRGGAGPAFRRCPRPLS